MSTVNLTLVGGSHASTPGSVELLYERILSSEWPLGTLCKILSLEEVSRSVAANRSSKTIVFLQSEGTRDPARSTAIRDWLCGGAIVVELNVFALPAADRPQLAAYIPAFLSWDGYCRHVIRATTAGYRPYGHAAILPYPLLHDVSSYPRRWDGSRVKLLRIGRPDIRKWTTFEVKLCRRLARQWPEMEFELSLVGAPLELLIKRSSLPTNLAVKVLPYSRDVSSLYSSNDIYIHYSRIGETYGNTLAEASVRGLPIICVLDPAWDCAPIEFLDQREHVIASPRRLLRNPPDVRALLRQRGHAHRGADALDVEEFTRRLLNIAESGDSMTAAPSLVQALRYLHQECNVLGSPVHERAAAPVREAVRSAYRRRRGL
jgi:hypothetical protein